MLEGLRVLGPVVEAEKARKVSFSGEQPSIAVVEATSPRTFYEDMGTN